MVSLGHKVSPDHRTFVPSRVLSPPRPFLDFLYPVTHYPSGRDFFQIILLCLLQFYSLCQSVKPPSCFFKLCYSYVRFSRLRFRDLPSLSPLPIVSFPLSKCPPDTLFPLQFLYSCDPNTPTVYDLVKSLNQVDKLPFLYPIWDVLLPLCQVKELGVKRMGILFFLFISVR